MLLNSVRRFKGELSLDLRDGRGKAGILDMVFDKI
jgi:hypothetical protein